MSSSSGRSGGGKSGRARPSSVGGLELGLVHQGDCVALMQDLMDRECVDLAFADPPFNVGYKYDVYDDRRTFDEYLGWSREWVEQVHRVLRPHGTFWLAIGSAMAADLDVMIRHLVGFHRRAWITWYQTFGQCQVKNFALSNTHLLYYTKHRERFTFNADQVRVPSTRQLIYNDRRANPDGRTPDSTWILRPQDLPEGFTAGEDTWHCPRINGTFKGRAGTPNQMPEQVLGRIIRACSDLEDVVLDNFCGSGTTPAVAKKLGRHYIGFELSEDYCKLANRRVAGVQKGDMLDPPNIQGE